MNPHFHKLVQAQVKAAKLYGKYSPENKAALDKCAEWQNKGHIHRFTKETSRGPLCAACNLPGPMYRG